MKIDKLKEVFEEFKGNTDRAVLIDGPWGSGKTFQVLEFLKSNEKNKKIKIVYVSLFGKTSIDEIHTELFRQFHPIKSIGRKAGKEILSIIPKAVGLINDSASLLIPNLEFILKTDRTCKLNNNNINQIVVLDDLERVDFKKISFNDILGYFNSLLMEQLKIIVICNTDEITDDNFIGFKEKIFDREYKISSTNKDIILNYFGVNNEALNEAIIKEFDNNLRLANRTNSFYKQVVSKLDNYNANWSTKISKQVLLWYCTLIVVGANSNKYIKYEKDKTNEKEKKGDLSDFFSFELKENSTGDKHIDLLVESVAYYSNDQLGYKNTKDIEFVLALVKLFYYNEESGLFPYFASDKEKEENPLLCDVFYLSDKEKKEILNKQYKYIISEKCQNKTRIYETIREFCNYSDMFQFEQKEQKLIDFLIKHKEDFEHEMYHIINFAMHDNIKFQSFSQKLNKCFNERLLNDYISKLLREYDEENYSSVLEILNELTTKTCCLETNSNGNLVLKKEIIDAIEEKEFFLSNLFGEIDYLLWSIALKIIDLSYINGFSNKIINYVRQLDLTKDFSAKERYRFLLKKLGQDI